jgi:hypothetical protein
VKGKVVDCDVGFFLYFGILVKISHLIKDISVDIGILWVVVILLAYTAGGRVITKYHDRITSNYI